MARTTLGVQLTPAEALVVRYRSGWRGGAVDRVFRVDVGQEPSPGESADTGPSPLAGADAVVTALAVDEVFRREVDLPFSDWRKAQRVAPLEAEESLPLPLEQLVCHVHPLHRGPSSSKCLVVAAPLDRVERLVAAVRRLGAEPQAVDVEPMALATVARAALAPGERALLIDLAPGLCQAVLLDNGVAQTFQAFSSGSNEPDLLDEASLFLGRHAGETPPTAAYLSGPDALVADLEAWRAALGLTVRHLPLPRRVTIGPEVAISWPAWAVGLGLALRGGRGSGAARINLLRGSLLAGQDIPSWRRIGAVSGGYAAALAVLWGASLWAEASYRQAQYQALDQAVRQTFHAALPEVTRIQDPAAQMRTRVGEIEARDRSFGTLLDSEVSPMRILANLSASIPKGLDVEFQEFVAEPGRVRIEATTTSYEASDRVKSLIMASSPRFSSVTSDATEGARPGEVAFRLTIRLGEEK